MTTEDLADALDDIAGGIENKGEYDTLRAAAARLRELSALVDEAAEAALTDLKAEAVEVVEALANAADGVGVAYFDSDDMPPVVETMQDATLAARDLLAKLKGEG